jgi:hypothetical protein
MTRRLLLVLPPMIAALLTQTGCSDVQPWEKQYLAKPTMALDPDPQERKLRNHVYGAREGAFGGYGVGGGGCGCN